jgi:allantoate deiminase
MMGSSSPLMAQLEALAQFSAYGAECLTRLYLSPEHKAANTYVMTLMRDAGMDAQIDAAGSVIGHYAASTPDAPTLLLGSHIDTVKNAGKYDGNFGVLAAIEAIRRLNAAGTRLPYTIEVLAFGDEEGVRFPVTLTTSRAVAGCFDPATLDAKDEAGITLQEALLAFGGDPAAIPTLARNPTKTLGYVELHIEQGPVLEAKDLPVGIVTAISGATRAEIRVEGFAGHAGTVPMELRRDAGAAAAEMLLAAETLARNTPDLVATIGRMAFGPGAVNVIPSSAQFTIDVRSPYDTVRTKAVETLKTTFAAIAAKRGVQLNIRSFYDEAAAPCDPALMAGLAEAVEQCDLRPHHLPSGAGHDGLAMISLCPIAMLFVRCKGGISHNPAESITPEDAEQAVAVLLAFLTRFSPDTIRSTR